MGVWGERFINDFLQLSLPSLLAPGNMPALAAHFKTQFVFLTAASDVRVFETDKNFQKLTSICDVAFVPMQDLIVSNNHSTTLTLAYDRAIRQTGAQMLNTYFILLNSDYIMADGSFEGLTRYIEKGYNAICAGNFQTIDEEIKPYLLSKIDPATGVMQISPRELVKQSMKHLHPVTIASLFDQQATHNYRANRFFARLNSQTMAGKFFLLHVLCIKPETMDYRVGASFDYSFVPEMCPSGNIGVINDSDDYLVIEAQPRNHELKLVDWGGYEQSKLIHALSEWTTKQHRDNVKHTIFYHANALSEQDKRILQDKLDGFIKTVSVGLRKHKEQPYYNHPYWYGAIESHQREQAILMAANDYDFVDMGLSDVSFAKKWFFRVMGVPPLVFRWHHRFREYRSITQLLALQIFPEKSKKTAIFYATYAPHFMRYRMWFSQKLGIQHHYYVKNLKHAALKLQALQAESFELCVLMLDVSDIVKQSDTLEMIRTVLKKNGKLLIFIPNAKNAIFEAVNDIQTEFTQSINVIVSTDYYIINVDATYNNLTMLGAITIERINQYFAYNKRLRFLFYMLIGLPGSLYVFFANCLPSFGNHKKNDHCTNILVTLKPAREPASNAS